MARCSLAVSGTAVAYFLTAEICARLSLPAAPVSLLWAPNAILVAALALTRPDRWWLYLAAVFVAHFVAQWPVMPTAQVVVQFFALSLLLLAGVLGERRRATAATQASELQRRQSEELYKAILATCENGMVVLDRAGKIIDVNPSWRERMGSDPSIPPGALPGASYFDCLDAWSGGIESAHIVGALHDVLVRDVAKRRIGYSVHTIGGVRWIEQTIQRLGRPEGGAVITMTDVTARKVAEIDAQARYADLTHLTRVAAVGGVSGAIAHELSQPLGAILGNAEAGLRLLERERTRHEDLRDILRDIAENSLRASDIVQRVRQLLRPGASPIGEHLNLSILVADVLRLVHHELLRRKVRLHADLPASLGLIEGDAVQIQQVILNLVMNACESMDENPAGERRIHVTTRRCGSNEVAVTVRDVGHGLRPEDLQRVFMPFVTSKATGLGLGLFISRRIVESHRGRLWCEPADPGAVFHMALPLID